jgi:hypothetical protein
MNRWALRTAAAAAILLALYAAAGWWLAPRLVRDALVEQATSRGLKLRLGEVSVHPFKFSLALRDVEVLAQDGRRTAALQALDADLSLASLWRPARYEASAVLAAGGVVRSHGTVSREPLAASGSLTLESVPIAEAWKLAAPGTDPVAGALNGSAEFAYEDGRFGLRDIALRAEPGAGGRLAASGAWDVSAGRGKLELRAEALPLSIAQRWLPPSAAVRVASGAASSAGTLEIGPKLRYAGSLRVDNLRLEERGTKQLLLAWRRGETGRFGFTAGRLELGEVKVQAAEARLVVGPGGVFNFAEAFGAGKRGGAFSAAFERLSVAGSTLHFADRSLESPFEVTVVELAGGMSGFSTAGGAPAQVQLNGRVPPYGSVRIRGTVDPGAPASLADIRARLRNLRLEAFNPYVTKFAGYRIESGRVSATLRYELREGRLVGSNDLVFEEMRLGEKVGDAGALDVPLELVVALLADAQGRITLDIPVRGDLTNPQFDFGAIVARAVGNVLRTVVAAPFRALASLLGLKNGDLGEIAFAPGRATLSPPAEEDVGRVAEALAERPKLRVTVRGGFDPARDLEALRMRAAREAIAVRAGVNTQEKPLDLEDKKVLRAAEALYLQRTGDREAMRKLRAGEEPYGRALVRGFAERLSIGQTAVDVLAQARAEAIRDALLAHGLDPGRVRIEPARPAAAAKGEGVVTRLALGR